MKTNVKKNQVDDLLAPFARHEAAMLEAAHAVVALGLGATVNEVGIDALGRGFTRVDTDPKLHPEYTASGPSLRDALRFRLLLHVSGTVLNALAVQWAYFGTWPTMAEIRKEKDFHEFDESGKLVSACVAAGEVDASLLGDLNQSVNSAINSLLNTSAGWSFVQEAVDMDNERKLVGVPRGEVVKEIQRAERRAEKILKSNWQAVESIAERLRKGKSRRITRGRLLKLAGNNVVKTESAR